MDVSKGQMMMADEERETVTTNIGRYRRYDNEKVRIERGD